MNNDIIQALKEYYSLKKKYELQINKKKKPIIRDEKLSKLEKKKQISKIQKKCINCNKLGGTIFERKGHILSAVCGNTKEPCNLKIEINRGVFKDLRKIVNYLKNDNENIKSKIIVNKLDLLFNYKTEEEVVSEFNELKDEYKTSSGVTDKLKDVYLNIINNTNNLEKLKLANETLYQQKEELRNLAKEFDETQRPAYIKEMVEKYVNFIQPLTQNIRDLKYRKQNIECSDGSYAPCSDGYYNLIQEPYTVVDFEQNFSLEEVPAILSNTK
jgi:hypothetical protein